MLRSFRLSATRSSLSALMLGALVLGACAPAAQPAPTTPPAPKPTAAPAAAAKPTAAAAKPAEAAKPATAASPAAKPAEAKPAASPAAAAKPAAAGARRAPSPEQFKAKPGTQLETVKLAQSIPALAFAPLIVAREMNFFEAQGLKLEFTELQSGATAQQAILSGSIDLTDSASTEVVAAVAKGIPLMAIQNTIMQTLEVCVRKDWLEKQGVKPDANLQERVAALKGATIGITGPGAVSDRAMRWLLTKYGNMDPNRDTQIIQVGGASAMAGALEQNRIQAFLLSPPNCEVTLDNGGVVLVKPDEIPEWKNYIHEVLYTTKDWLEKNPEKAKKAATAISMGNNFMLEYPEESIKILQKEFDKVDPKIIEQAVRQTILPQVVKDGKMTEDMWKNTNIVLVEAGLIDQPVDVQEGVMWTNQYIGDASIPPAQ